MRTGAAASRSFRLAATALSLALAVSLNIRLERPGAGPTRHSLYLPSGQYLRVAALAYKDLLADLLYVWSIQYYSNDRTERWRYLARLYDAITDLDPRFVVAYSIGGLILAVEAGQPEEALVLLDKGIEENPDTYLLAWEAAFHARAMKDLRRASAYLAYAKSRPDAPPYVARWHAHTLHGLGEPREALALWVEALATARNPHERRVAQRWVHDLSVKVLVQDVGAKVEEFRARNGRPPVALEELVRAGLLESVPADTAGHALRYDRRTGEVSPSCSFLVRHGWKRGR